MVHMHQASLAIMEASDHVTWPDAVVALGFLGLMAFWVWVGTRD